MRIQNVIHTFVLSFERRCGLGVLCATTDSRSRLALRGSIRAVWPTLILRIIAPLGLWLDHTVNTVKRIGRSKKKESKRRSGCDTRVKAAYLTILGQIDFQGLGVIFEPGRGHGK